MPGKRRSSSSMTLAAVSDGTAKITANEVVRMAQRKSGSRLMDIPGARILKMVTMKLMAPAVVAKARKIRDRV